MTFDELKTNVIETKIAANGTGNITGPILQEVLIQLVDTTESYILTRNPSKENALISEAYAKGTKGGVSVKEGDAGYEDNSLYYKEQGKSFSQSARVDAQSAEDSAKNATEKSESAESNATKSKQEAEMSEAYAKGTKNGTPVASGEEGYQDNSQYYRDDAKQMRDDTEKYYKDNDWLISVDDTLDGHAATSFDDIWEREQTAINTLETMESTWGEWMEETRKVQNEDHGEIVSGRGGRESINVRFVSIEDKLSTVSGDTVADHAEIVKARGSFESMSARMDESDAEAASKLEKNRMKQDGDVDWNSDSTIPTAKAVMDKIYNSFDSIIFEDGTLDGSAAISFDDIWEREQAAINTLETMESTWSGWMEETRALISTNSNEIVAARGGKNNLKERIDGIEEDCTLNANGIVAVNKRIEDVDDIVDKDHDEIVSARGRFADVNSRFDSYYTTISQSANEIAYGRGGYANLNNRFIADENSHKELRSEVDTAKGTYDSLNARLNSMENAMVYFEDAVL